MSDEKTSGSCLIVAGYGEWRTNGIVHTGPLLFINNAGVEMTFKLAVDVADGIAHALQSASYKKKQEEP